MSHTAEDLRALQAKTLEEKIQISTARIIEWYEHWNGQVYVSFSGGKDSTVLLNLVRRVYQDVPAVFSDTGLEFPEIREFVKSFDNVEWVKPKIIFPQVIAKYGYPIISKSTAYAVYYYQPGNYQWQRLNGIAKGKDGRESLYNCRKWSFLTNADFPISHHCCNVMKKRPIHEYEKITKRHPFIATMVYESLNRKNGGCKKDVTLLKKMGHLHQWLFGQNKTYYDIFKNTICLMHLFMVS